MVGKDSRRGNRVSSLDFYNEKIVKLIIKDVQERIVVRHGIYCGSDLEFIFLFNTVSQSIEAYNKNTIIRIEEAKKSDKNE